MSTLRVRMVSKIEDNSDVLWILLIAIGAFWFTLNNLLKIRPTFPGSSSVDSEQMREQKQLLIEGYMGYAFKQSIYASLLLAALVGVVFWILWVIRSEDSQLKAARYGGVAIIVSLVFGVAMYVACYLLSDIDEYRRMLG